MNQIIQHIEQFTKEHVELCFEPKERPVNGIVLYGPSGSGKSSVYGELVRRIGQDNRFCLKYASCGLSACSSDFLKIKKYWGDCFWDARLGLNEQITAKGKRYVYLLDSVENLVSTRDVASGFTHYLNTINPYVLTCTEDYLGILKQEIVHFQERSHRKGDCLYIRIPDVTIEDVQAVITAVLEDNYKQLSPMCQQALCARLKKGENSQAFLFWLRLALSVLMEFGAEDFRKIHAILAKNDSDKIERYLIQTIESFPDDLDGMIKYFIRLTYDIFDKTITDSLLYYLIHSRYGLTVQFFEELLGKNWHSLEFESLLYWFREFIRKDTYTGRLTIGHRSFHQAIDSISCANSDLFALFEKLYIEGKVEDREYIYMVMQAGDMDRFHDYIQTVNGVNGNLPSDVPPVLALFIRDNEKRCFDFLSRYFSKYFLDPHNDVLAFEVSWGRTEGSGGGYRLKRKAIDLLLKQFTYDIVRNGDMDVVYAYFKFCKSITFDHLGESRGLKNPVRFEDVKSVYLDNKRLYGTRIVQYWLPSTFFEIWVESFRNSTKVIDYLEYVDECRWFSENIDYVACIDLYRLWVDHRIIPHGGFCPPLEIEEELHIMQVVQNDYLSLLSPELEKDVFWFPHFLKEGLKLIDYYREGHSRFYLGRPTRSVSFVPTKLSNYIEKMIKENPQHFFNTYDYDDAGVAVIKWSGGEIRHVCDE